MTLLINVALLALGSAGTLSAFGGETWTKGPEPILRRVTCRGWIALACLLASLSLGVVKEVNSDATAVESARHQREIDDAVIRFKPFLEQAQHKDQEHGGVIPQKLTAEDVRTLLNKGSKNLPVAKILWVDDHPTNNQVARLALAALGIYCDSYTKTADAIEAIQWNAQNSKRPYDMVISDVHRDHELGSDGHSQSGIDTYEQVRTIPGYHDTLFVFFTATGINEVLPIINRDSNAASTNYFDVLFERVLRGIPSTSTNR